MKKIIITLLIPLLACSTTVFANYHVDSQIGKGALGPVSQLAVGANDSLCALENSGKVTVFKPDSTIEQTIETGMANTDAIAISADGTIYVLSTLTEMKRSNPAHAW